MPIVLDTHAWVWWVTGDRRLSPRLAQLIKKTAAAEGVWISAISVWEVAKKVQKRQLVLDRPLESWMESALAQEGLGVVELTPPILFASCQLPEPFHGDPADQMIVATVRLRRGQLITKDEKIRQYPHVVTLW